MAIERRFHFQYSARESSLIYPVSWTRMSIRSRECPNQTLKVDALTMRHPTGICCAGGGLT
jgi:hypothetical protein